MLAFDSLRDVLKERFWNRSVFELLLGVEPAVRFFAGSGFHAAVNEADPKAPVLKNPDEIIERVFKLSEN